MKNHMKNNGAYLISNSWMWLMQFLDTNKYSSGHYIDRRAYSNKTIIRFAKTDNITKS